MVILNFKSRNVFIGHHLPLDHKGQIKEIQNCFRSFNRISELLENSFCLYGNLNLHDHLILCVR